MKQEDKYNVITLCGSIKFESKFLEVQEQLTLKGNIVLIPNFFSNNIEINDKTKNMLGKMHRQKIDMADEIYIINVGGYIGESTNYEIEYAKSLNKKVTYLENV